SATSAATTSEATRMIDHAGVSHILAQRSSRAGGLLVRERWTSLASRRSGAAISRELRAGQSLQRRRDCAADTTGALESACRITRATAPRLLPDKVARSGQTGDNPPFFF